jgi:acetyl-CoA carboxylase biotin carboxyl carrier protein
MEAHMKIAEIKELIESVAHHGITELEIDSSGMKLKIRKELPVASLVVPAAPAALPVVVPPGPLAPPLLSSEAVSPGTVPGPPAPSEAGDLFLVRSPIVGTFYRAPNPNADPFVKVGDEVEPGRVLCIVEAMKLMNEIESEVSGEMTRIFVENGESVEFGQALFGIRLTKKA